MPISQRASRADDTGISSRVKRLSWTYTGKLQQEVHYAAFVQEEYRPINALTVLGSYRIDLHPLLDNGKPGYAQSPRLSVLWQPVDGQGVGLRFEDELSFERLAGEAFRTGNQFHDFSSSPGPWLPGC